MDFEFDKEIDSLLRQTVQEGEMAFANPQSQIRNAKSPVHLDADEISAFAENALPGQARLNAMEHLADCTRCRKILADVISFNAEEPSEIIHAVEEPKTIVAVPKIPWYSQLFAFPNLAYTMGAIALLFCGVLSYVVFQSVGRDQNVAQMEKVNERPLNAKGASSDGASAPSTTYANTNASSANTSAASNSAATAANTAANSPAVYATPMSAPVTSNSNAAGPVLAGNIDKSEDLKTSIPKDISSEDAVTNTADSPRKEEKKPASKSDLDDATKSGNYQVDGVDRGRTAKQAEVTQNASPPPSIAQNQTNIYPDSRNVQRSNNNVGGVPATPRESTEVRDEQPKNKIAVAKKSAPNKSEDSRNRSDESKNVGGKTFRSVNGIWTDTAYTGGDTKKVKRSSGDYKKLDSGLRSIADTLGGTVIIVWTGKAYKIQ